MSHQTVNERVENKLNEKRLVDSFRIGFGKVFSFQHFENLKKY